MDSKQKIEHWNNIYSTKLFEEVSWYEPVPKLSLELVAKYCLFKDSNIIDVGGGVSYLSQSLLELGHTNVTVLDISSKAIETTKIRMGQKANNINWIVADASSFETNLKFDFWHDRAAFHFLNNERDISNYIQMTNNYINKNGYLVIGTFSDKGPTKCSGIEISQYSEEKITSLFTKDFELVDSFYQDHTTPSGSVQNFIYTVFKKR